MCAPASAAHAADKLSSQQILEIRQLSTDVLSKNNLPGLSVAVAKGDHVWSAGFGSADLEQNVALDSRSLFRTASISKWLTATAALRLFDEGKLDLDAPVQQYCPQYPQKQWAITTRQLLSHLAGIRHYHGANGEPRDTEEQRRNLDELIKREQSTQYTRYTDIVPTLDAFKDDPLLFQPGTHFLYSSLGYRVLACVLEGAAHTPYRELMRRLVFTPAGMSATTEDDSQAIILHRVSGYARGPDNTLTRAQFRDISENLPAGGHLATAEDLVRFAAAFNSGKLVQARTRDLMIQRPKLLDGTDVPDAPPYFGMGTGLYYGMGIFVGSSPAGALLLRHTGRQPGASTELLLAPERRIAVAVMTNVSGWNGADGLAKKVAEIAGKE
ncbi:MAG TPA: serine hydrolase domain-containing protein [Povalibacter sp.]|nr:serine hydrolase domain-containing protein [Povalibacter sp.]